MSEETVRTLFGAVQAYIDAEAEVIYLREIDEPATADVGKRFGGRAEALAVSVATAAAAIGLTPPTVYALIACGRFAPTITAPGGTAKVMVDELDSWVWELIEQAETAWYADRAGGAGGGRARR